MALHADEKIELTGTLKVVEAAEINRRMALGDTFVVNVIATWCPDCTERQKNYIDGFAQLMKSQDVDVLQVNVQRSRGDFIDEAHKQLTHHFGGHGYPRTVLIKRGTVVDQNNVEVIAEDTLSALARKFIEIIAKS